MLFIPFILYTRERGLECEAGTDIERGEITGDLAEARAGGAAFQVDAHHPRHRITLRTRPIIVRQPCNASGGNLGLEACNGIHIIAGTCITRHGTAHEHVLPVCLRRQTPRAAGDCCKPFGIRLGLGPFHLLRVAVELNGETI